MSQGATCPLVLAAQLIQGGGHTVCLLIDYGVQQLPSICVIGRRMKSGRMGVRLEKRIKGENTFRCYVIRNYQRYAKLTGRELRAEYERQRNTLLDWIFPIPLFHIPCSLLSFYRHPC